MVAAFDPIFVYGNYAEACLWAGIAMIVWSKARRQSIGRFLAMTLFAFGVSDIVESRTGAWYNPWWLLAWKTVCVLLILILGMKLHRASKIRDDR